jgi:maltose-binding protein MalE
VPLGYETLGIFYNKSVIREVPKTWNELENLYRTFSAGQFPTNIGLGPTYTPNMIDIIPLWFNEINTTNYQEVSTNQNALSNYLSYGKLEIGNISDDD